MDETELIARSQQGDGTAFSQLVRLYGDRIFNLSHHVCAGAPSEAEDIYQETFVTAFKKIRQYQSRSHLGTWLYRIAANLCWMKLRRRKNERTVPIVTSMPGEGPDEGVSENILKDPKGDPAKRAHRKEVQEVVTAALEALPVDYRLAVVLKDMQGLSNEEIAKILNLSLPAVKSRLHRGRLLLRTRLNKYVHGGAHP
ncbi:MAG TPA: sigma-70 family RNA polymerase sigma factor [Elusimicrobiota bacterium]|nr:sigma-70 family RNA polymerase sigma factor [Elusimicrobiota bacterium]